MTKGIVTGCLLLANLSLHAGDQVIRLGLFSEEFTGADGIQQSTIRASTRSGWIMGDSNRYYSDGTFAGSGYWIANMADGISTRIGLYESPEFSQGPKDVKNMVVNQVTESGYFGGHSLRYFGTTTSAGRATWLTDGNTGVTMRVGLYDAPEFVRDENFVYNSISALSESGYAVGSAYRYNGSVTIGDAVWVADIHTGVTHRVGLYGEGYQNGVYQTSTALGITESGYAVGSSAKYNGETLLGEVGWAADAVTGVTERIGLYSGDYISTDGMETVKASILKKSGYVGGHSTIYNGGEDARGQAGWVADLNTGDTRRVGFYEGDEFTHTDGSRNTTIQIMTESGYAGGFSTRYNGSKQIGQAAWIEDFSDPESIKRIGLRNGEFTSTDGTESSTIIRISETGYVTGTSARYSVTSERGTGAWVDSAGSGESIRVGLFTDAVYSSSDGTQVSTPSNISRNGIVVGISNRYYNASVVGSSAWFANAQTGETVRIGLFDEPEFNGSNNLHTSTVDPNAFTESGYIAGSTKRYSGTTELGDAAWVANTHTGETIRVGLTTDPAYSSTIGKQASYISQITESGYVGGYSQRYTATDGNGGQTAWVFDLTSETTFSFELSVRSSDHYSYSKINSVSEEGLALGYFTLYDGETSLGNRAFIWSVSTGTQILDEEISGGLLQYGWDYFTDVRASWPDGTLLGLGVLSDGNKGVYLVKTAEAVPEPGSTALVLVGLGGLWAAYRRRQRP